ncbi:MAG: alpha/beta fold hydrolase [bacterium]|nr:alpha/beta fold hydrolase [bacterium]
MKRLLITLLGGALMIMGGCAGSHDWYHLPALEFDEVDYGYVVHKAQVRNIEVAYLDEGSGPETMLLIHGLGSNAKGWLRNIPAWSSDHRVIAVDLPGYGKSDKGHYDYSLAFYVQVLGELLDQLGVDEAVWVGHSMGGQIALVAALEQSERVERLVLISPAGLEVFDEGEGAWLSGAVTPEFVRDTPIRNVAINLKSNFYASPPEADFMITDRIQVRGASDFENYCYAVSKNVGAMIDAPVRDRLGDLTQPVLVLFGEQDRLIPNPYLHGGWTREVAAIGENEIPGAKVLLLPECGHFVQFEKPAETNAAVLDFLD